MITRESAQAYWGGAPYVRQSEFDRRPLFSRHVIVKASSGFDSRWLMPDEVPAFMAGRPYIEERLDSTIWHPGAER